MKTTILILASGLPCWLIWLLAMLLSFLLGWLLHKFFGAKDEVDCDWESNSNPYKSKYESVKSTQIQGFTSQATATDEYKPKFDAAQSEIAALKAEISSLKKVAPISAVVSSPTPSVDIDIDYKAAGAILGKKVVKDDLKLVEGIGPKIEELFHANGLKTWSDVANASLEKLKDAIHSGGDRFAMHNPGTWSKQCQFMVDNQWAELKDYQDHLNAGKD